MFSGHFSMVEGHKPHPLRQVMSRPWETDDGMTQLRASSLPKGELLELFSALPLGHLPSLIVRGKLVLKKDDLTGKAFGILTSRGQHRGILHLRPQHPLQCLPPAANDTKF
jgi:hypothetical protein